jgi:hypothetical protein
MLMFQTAMFYMLMGGLCWALTSTPRTAEARFWCFLAFALAIMAEVYVAFNWSSIADMVQELARGVSTEALPPDSAFETADAVDSQPAPLGTLGWSSWIASFIPSWQRMQEAILLALLLAVSKLARAFSMLTGQHSAQVQALHRLQQFTFHRWHAEKWDVSAVSQGIRNSLAAYCLVVILFHALTHVDLAKSNASALVLLRREVAALRKQLLPPSAGMQPTGSASSDGSSKSAAPPVPSARHSAAAVIRSGAAMLPISRFRNSASGGSGPGQHTYVTTARGNALPSQSPAAVQLRISPEASALLIASQQGSSGFAPAADNSLTHLNAFALANTRPSTAAGASGLAWAAGAEGDDSDDSYHPSDDEDESDASSVHVGSTSLLDRVAASATGAELIQHGPREHACSEVDGPARHVCFSGARRSPALAASLPLSGFWVLRPRQAPAALNPLLAVESPADFARLVELSRAAATIERYATVTARAATGPAPTRRSHTNTPRRTSAGAPAFAAAETMDVDGESDEPTDDATWWSDSDASDDSQEGSASSLTSNISDAAGDAESTSGGEVPVAHRRGRLLPVVSPAAGLLPSDDTLSGHKRGRGTMSTAAKPASFFAASNRGTRGSPAKRVSGSAGDEQCDGIAVADVQDQEETSSPGMIPKKPRRSE